MTEMVIPGVFKCLNPYCIQHSKEYLVWVQSEKVCPHCKVQGEWRRQLKDRRANKFTCGICLSVLWLGNDEWPVGQYNWGVLQLGPKKPVKYVCCACLDDLKLKYPNLTKNTSFEEAEEVLPRIVHLAKADG